MAGWKDILLDVLKLTDEVKRLNSTTEKLAERTIDMDKRLVRLETMVEVAQQRRISDDARNP
jgi:predicted nuclease with TOPRIM domain